MGAKGAGKTAEQGGRGEMMGGINPLIPRSCRSREEARVSSSNGRRIRQTGSLSARDFFSVNRLSRRNRRLSCRFFFSSLPSNQRRPILMYERNPELITERNNRGRSVGWRINSNSGNYGKKWVTDRGGEEKERQREREGQLVGDWT